MRAWLLVSLFLIVTGCSNKSIYEGIQINQRSQCAEKQGNEYLDCIDENKKSYEEYKKDLEDLQNN